MPANESVLYFKSLFCIMWAVTTSLTWYLVMIKLKTDN